MLEMVRQLIGVVPDCDRYLEIWPTGFRTYNLIVPQFPEYPAGHIRPRRAQSAGRVSHVHGQPRGGMPLLYGPHV